MPFQIKHKATGQIVAVNSGKTVWSTAGAAKAAFITSGIPSYRRDEYGYKPSGDKLDEDGRRLGRKAWRFDNQDVFELVEVTDCAGNLKRALALLKAVITRSDQGYWVDHSEEIEEFLKEQE